MQPSLQKKDVSNQRAWLIVCCVSILVATACVCMGFLKLSSGAYNALDFGIFHQVIANTAHGDFFAMTIHPHIYLGDHVSPFLLVLAALYRIAATPETLVIVQVLAVVLAVWPLYRMTHSLHAGARVVICVSYLFSPLVLNAALFEFELIVFTLPLLFAALLAYIRKQFWLFCFWMLLAATIREDVGLIACGFALYAWVDRRSWRWRLVPATLGLAVFIGGMLLTGLFNTEHYKFLRYYSWAGQTPSDVLHTLFLRPWVPLLRLLRPHNLLFLLTLLLLAAGLPLLRLRTLLPTIFAALALLLTSFGGDAIALRTHYPVLFIPFLFWGIVEGVQRLQGSPPRRIKRFLVGSPVLCASVLLFTVAAYGFFTMSPLKPQAVFAIISRTQDPRTRAATIVEKQVAPSSAVAAGYRFLARQGNRRSLYALNYAFSGRRQFSDLPYALPEDTDRIVYDASDYHFYFAQYEKDDRFTSGDDRLRAILEERGFHLVTLLDTFLVYTRGGNAHEEPPFLSVGKIAGRAVSGGSGNLTLAGIDGQDTALRLEPARIGDATVPTLPITLTWVLREKTDDPYSLRVQYVDAKNRVQATRWYPLGYGITPTTEWPVGTPVAHRFVWVPPSLAPGTYQIRLQIAAPRGYLGLDPVLSAYFHITNLHPIGNPYELGTLTLTSDPARTR